MVQIHRGLLTLALAATMLRPAFAAAPPNQVSLNTCQKTVKAEGAKFVQAEILAIATCLQKLSLEAVQNNVAFDSAAARLCITQFRKLNDSRGAGKSLKEKLTLKIRMKCDRVFNTSLLHTDDDITGKGSPTVPVPINTQQLDLWCTNFGGDGSIDGVHTPAETTVQEWIDCIVAAHQCEVEQAIAEQYPRAAAWLSAVKPLMVAVPTPSADPNKISDAVAGLTTVHDAIDKNDTGAPHITCPKPPLPPSCSTACCYVEQSNGPVRPTSCFQYTGSGAEVTTFKTNCGAATSAPIAGFYTFTATNVACAAGPMFGVPCVVGAGNNAVAIPKDSACP
jgi:hypothetical protein